MSLKINQRTNAPLLRDGSALPTPGSGMGLDAAAVVPQKVTIKLDGATLSIDEGDDFGSLKLCDLPDLNLQLFSVEADLTLVKGGVSNGLEAAVDVNVAIGSAAATAQDLTATAAENDKIESTALTDNSLTVSLAAHSLGQSGDGAMPQQIGDGASNALWLNASVTAGITASDALTVTGTVTLILFSLGNVTS